MKIFVSYSRRDAGDFANQIQRHLSSFKYDIFTDVDSIRAGEVWSNTITTNISSCDIFVVIVTYGALHSPHVESEVLQAQKENKKIIPCFFKGINPNKIKWGLEKIQGVEFTNEYQLARDLYSKIDIEPDISNDKGTGSIIGSASKTITDVKTSETTPINSNFDILAGKKNTISASPKVIKDDIQSESSHDLVEAVTTKKEEKEKRKYTEEDSIDKPSQDIFGSVSKPIEEREKDDVTNTKVTAPPAIKTDTEKPHQKKDTLHQSSTVRTGAIGGSGISPSSSIYSKHTKETKNTVTTNTSFPLKSDTDKPHQKKDTDIYIPSKVQIPKSPINLKIVLPIVGVFAAILLVVIVFVNPFGSETPPSGNIVHGPLPPNSLPIASDKSVTTSFNTPIDITLEATDENVDDELSATIVRDPGHGTLSEIDQSTGTVTYTPKQDFEGTDTFEYKVNDGTTDSNNAVVTVTVSGPANAVPIASDKSVTTSSGTAVDITLEATDENVDDELSATIVTQPEHGTLGTIDQSTGIVTYTPDDNYNGEDSFTYRVNDVKSDSNKATITITVG